jgi:hypothetical protein
VLRQVPVIVTGDEATCFSDHGDFANIRRAQPDRRVGHPPSGLCRLRFRTRRANRCFTTCMTVEGVPWSGSLMSK